MRKQRNPTAGYLKAKGAAAAFDKARPALAARCEGLLASGISLDAISTLLNEEGLSTKTGKAWSAANVWQLLRNPAAPKPPPESAASRKRDRLGKRKLGVWKTNDVSLGWAAKKYPHLVEWRALASEWASGRETGLSHALQGVNALIDFIGKHSLPADPAVFLLHRTAVPDFYKATWGTRKTNGKVLIHNNAHYFLQWVLTKPQFCAEDDEGRLLTSPAFRNPLPFLSRSGLGQHSESVRSTLPYGYIEELRTMIAEGPDFRDWKWAQSAMGFVQDSDDDEEESSSPTKIASIWFEVASHKIDKSDPDCVWRTRTRLIPNEVGLPGMGRKRERVYEIWSPVRWVALLIKLQLPLRTLQVRLLDSGEADTWRWQSGEWSVNDGRLARGTAARPHSNGVFLKPNQLVDGDAKVLLHINTNKTADVGKEGHAKGYNVPWIVGGPRHQDPFYWLEKLARWQSKYNPLKQLVKWTELDGRHIPAKSVAQLASYPDTAFLFRCPESAQPNLPLTIQALDRPWFICLSALEDRLAKRGESLPRGDRIRLLPAAQKKNSPRTFFSLHSLRVSLITALALDGEVPLVILQKIAGHSRLVMTLYYTKPGATQLREAIQAGVQRLNESAGATIVDWLANAEYTQLVKEVIANSIESFKAAIPEAAGLRSPAGWMTMVDGLCLVGGNVSEVDAPGCHNGGPNIGSPTAPRYIPVPGGARNCPRCRWFITRPYFLPQLAARWNNIMYHCDDAKAEVIAADERFRELEDIRAAAIAAGEVFGEQEKYKEAERVRERAIRKFDELTMNVSAVTRLIERCRRALQSGDGTALLATGIAAEFEYVIEEVDSELLQVSGVSQGCELYPDLEPSKAVLRQSQLLDAALARDNMRPIFLMLSEQEQMQVGNAFVRQLASQMNPANPALGRFQVVSLIDAGKSLRQHFGDAVERHLAIATGADADRRVIPMTRALPDKVETP